MKYLSLSLLVVLVGVLGVLQYRWIGEISQMEKKKLQDYLQSSLNEVSRDFNSELSSECRALFPRDAEVKQLGRKEAYERRYDEWKRSSNNPKLFSRIGVVWEQDGALTLQMLNSETAEWPPEWNWFKERRSRGPWEPGGPPGPMRPPDDGALIDLPRFGGEGPGGPPREREWLLLEVDRRYVADVMLPELLARHFGNNYQQEYHVEVFARASKSADASVMLGGPGGPPGPPPPERGPERGRWRLSVALKAGSLEAVVSRARVRNLAVSGAILLLILATGAALVRYTRQTQRLAEMEMEFVAGVSHELGTPLAVIRTAAYNLRGKMAGNPSQVEIYGALIQQQSEKLTAIVEQVLQFAGARAGRIIREREPVSVERLIDDSLESSRGLLEESLCLVEKQIEPGLPSITGDSVALRHALENLIGNALKYGMGGGKWIGVSAHNKPGIGGTNVEIRISDRGPGIPAEERKHVFDPFFRGKRAIHDQIHGTGLGLNLVKKIVEAHGGTVEVESEPGAGTTFIVRIPTRPPEHQDEFAHSLG